MKKLMIDFDQVSKSFSWYRENRLKIKLGKIGDKNEEVVEAVRNISFKVYEGEVVGLYGPNGSGKTTVLRLLAGIVQPDRGKVRVEGIVMPVLDLGLGLDPELTGEENVFLFGSILGLPERRVRQSLKKIIRFSGIEKFIKMPVKKYSAGMRARLAFSTALFSEADILLLDEILSVGDLEFRAKCEKAIKQLKNRKTVVLVSHDLNQIYRYCDRMYYIDKGRIVKSSNTRLKQFLRSLGDEGEFVCEASSNSMWPVIAKGDRLVVKRIPFKKLKVGDVIAFSLENLSEIIVHRVAGVDRKKEKRLLTKGDASLDQDPWGITEKNYLGKVVKVKS